MTNKEYMLIEALEEAVIIIESLQEFGDYNEDICRFEELVNLAKYG